MLAKAADVITYVEHGVCDLGVVGKDTILENGSSFYELLDLGFGKCRFALATKKDSDFYGGYKTKTIASKYPNVTRAFFDDKNMDVRIIKIKQVARETGIPVEHISNYGRYIAKVDESQIGSFHIAIRLFCKTCRKGLQ